MPIGNTATAIASGYYIAVLLIAKSGIAAYFAIIGIAKAAEYSVVVVYHFVGYLSQSK